MTPPDQDKKWCVALAVGLIDHTFERVGNSESAEDGHFGVTGWKVKHVSFKGRSAVIRYVGKSGVKHEKVVDDALLVRALKKAVEGKSPEDEVCGGVTSRDVNAYLEPFEVTAKDIRGYHANRMMAEQLQAVRKKGPKLPTDRKEKEKVLKAEFKEALVATAEAVGHEAATLRSQYLSPGVEDDYLKDGTVRDTLKDAASKRDKTAVIHVNNVTDGLEDLRGQAGMRSVVSSKLQLNTRLSRRIASSWMQQATKSPAEREDEEIERLVRPPPKKKPPRDDSRRERVDTSEDAERDIDLSLNYKDVGG